MVRLTPTRLLCATIIAAAFFLFFGISSSFFRERGFDILPDQPLAPASHPPPSSSSSSSPPQAQAVLGKECSPFAGGAMDKVAIVLKLGAGEVASKLPAYLAALKPCKPDLLLFSDRKDQFDDYPIVDALANLRPEYRYRNPDFDIYDELQRTKPSPEKTQDGWKLDKYKFLPMMELTAHLRPESQWFVFIELDTYINWDNLYRFLTRFNPKSSHYFGSPVWPKKKPVFAHGGSGFILSRGSLNGLVARGKMFADNRNFPGTHLFGKDLQGECCGDQALAQVLKETGVTLRGYWPMFNGEKPTSVRFGPEHWCEAIVSLHHLHEEDFSVMRRWEATRQHPNKPLTFEELFAMIEPSLSDQVDNWTNMSEDVVLKSPEPAAKSFKTCFSACLKDSKCVQYEHYGGVCRLSHYIRLGHEQQRNGKKKYISGWMKDRIQAFKATHSPCQGAHIVHPNP